MSVERLAKLLKEESYNTQLHGITYNQFVDQIRLPFNEACHKSFEDLGDKLIEEGEDEKEVSKGFDILTSRLFQEDASQLTGSQLKEYELHPEHYSKIDRALDKLACAAHLKYFHVPEHILLPEDLCHKQTTESTAVVSTNRNLYNQVIKEKQLSTHLDDRIATLKEMKYRLDKANLQLKTLESFIA